MKVRYYGVIQERIGMDEQELQASSSEELMDQLKTQHPFLEDMTYTLFKNQELIRGDVPLQYDDEVVLCPPFSGG